MDIILHVMTSKGFIFLKTFLKYSNKKVLYVVSESDKSINNDFFNEIKNLCNEFSITFYKRNECPSLIQSDLVIAVSWKWIINHCQNKIIVIHDSLLPKLRGFNPLVTALINGHKEIGATAIYASKEYDQGEIIYQSKTTINYPITIEKAINLIHKNYIEIAVFITKFFNNDSLPPSEPQDEGKASYSLWRNDSDYFINWFLSSVEIIRFIDAVGYPYKGAASYIHDTQTRIIKASLFDDVNIENRCPGKIIFQKGDFPIVVCGKGLIKIEKLENNSGESLLPLSKFRIKFTT